MYNSDMPTRADLPKTGQLIRSTLIAIAAAATLLITVILPAEYAVDPTGIGSMIGLAKMGQIKAQLAEEAALDRAAEAVAVSDVLVTVPAPVAPIVSAEVTPTVAELATPEALDIWRDEITITLRPDEAAEVKLAMTKGSKAEYSWTASGRGLNFDLHGDRPGSDEFVSYEKGRAALGAQGVFEAAFDGYHGWFLRNRSGEDVTVTLRTKGAYNEMKRVM